MGRCSEAMSLLPSGASGSGSQHSTHWSRADTPSSPCTQAEQRRHSTQYWDESSSLYRFVLCLNALCKQCCMHTCCVCCSMC